MKHFILSLIAIFCSVSAFSQANGAATQQFFQLPIVPDSIQNFQRRCDYMLAHYWDFCDLKKAFSSRDKMADAFDMYLSFMPYATASEVFSSVDNFFGRISRQPKDVEFIASMAESRLYSDSAEYKSEELYSHFLDNILKIKKISKESRNYYQAQSRILHNSREGMIAPSFDFVDPKGRKMQFIIDPNQFATVLMFTSPNSTAANLARLRLDADIKTSQLIESGMVKIYQIYVEEPDTTPATPNGWTTGIAPGIETVYDVSTIPMFYILNSSGKILKKGPDVDPLLNVMQQIRIPKKKKDAPDGNLPE